MAESPLIKFENFSQDLAQKVHDLANDVLQVALTNTEPDPALDSVLTDIVEISYTYCSSRVVTVTSAVQTGGIFKLIIEPIFLEASGGSVGPFQFIVLFNQTAVSDNLIGYWHNDKVVTILDTKSFTLLVDVDEGILQIQ